MHDPGIFLSTSSFPDHLQLQARVPDGTIASIHSSDRDLLGGLALCAFGKFPAGTWQLQKAIAGAMGAYDRVVAAWYGVVPLLDRLAWAAAIDEVFDVCNLRKPERDPIVSFMGASRKFVLGDRLDCIEALQSEKLHGTMVAEVASLRLEQLTLRWGLLWGLLHDTAPISIDNPRREFNTPSVAEFDADRWLAEYPARRHLLHHRFWKIGSRRGRDIAHDAWSDRSESDMRECYALLNERPRQEYPLLGC